MDFVISNVTTVDEESEEEDEEPLLEIKKVSILKEKTKYNKTEPKSKVRNTTTYKKTCYVPLCPNSSTATPEKMFITIPVNPSRRKLWLDAVGKVGGKNPKSPMFCCQDHFNLESDMRNYDEHLKIGKVQMLLHRSAVPHIFICDQYGHLEKNERIEVLRKLHKEISFGACKHVVRDEVYAPAIEERPQIKKPLQQKALPTSRKRRVTPKVKEEAKVNKTTVFIEIPSFDEPDYVIEPNGIVDTIVIDDSDDER